MLDRNLSYHLEDRMFAGDKGPPSPLRTAVSGKGMGTGAGTAASNKSGMKVEPAEVSLPPPGQPALVPRGDKIELLPAPQLDYWSQLKDAALRRGVELSSFDDELYDITFYRVRYLKCGHEAQTFMHHEVWRTAEDAMSAVVTELAPYMEGCPLEKKDQDIWGSG